VRSLSPSARPGINVLKVPSRSSKGEARELCSACKYLKRDTLREFTYPCPGATRSLATPSVRASTSMRGFVPNGWRLGLCRLGKRRCDGQRSPESAGLREAQRPQKEAHGGSAFRHVEVNKKPPQNGKKNRQQTSNKTATNFCCFFATNKPPDLRAKPDNFLVAQE
jgi:hypothetical protein